MQPRDLALSNKLFRFAERVKQAEGDFSSNSLGLFFAIDAALSSYRFITLRTLVSSFNPPTVFLRPSSYY
jgi:hypothetical protein